MKVYALLVHTDYEGDELQAILSDKKEAEKIAKEMNEHEDCSTVCQYRVDEIEVDNTNRIRL